MSVTKRIAKNFSWLLLGSVIAGALNFIANVYLARVLQAAAFGLLFFARAFLSYLVLLVDSGLSIFGAREIARDRSRTGNIANNILLLRLLIACIIFFGSFFVLYLLPLTNQMRLLFLATFLFLFYRALNPDWVFQGLEKMEFNGLLKFFVALFSFTLIIVFVHQPRDLIKVPIILGLTGVFVAIIFLWLLFKFFSGFKLANLSPKTWKNFLLKAFPLAAAVIMIQIYNNLDTIMLGVMDSQVVVGYYNAAYQILFVLVGLFGVWQTTAVPVVNKKMAVDKNQAKTFVNKYLKLTVFAVAPLVGLNFFLAPIIINLVYGSGYVNSVTALQALIWALAPITLGGATFGVLVLVPAGRFNSFFIAVALGAALNVFLNYLLIPQYSYIGAAIATIIAEICVGLITFYLAKRIFSFDLKPLLEAAIFSGLAAYLAVGLYADLFLTPVIFIILYLLLLLLVERKFILDFVREVIRVEQPGIANEPK